MITAENYALLVLELEKNGYYWWCAQEEDED